jgi:hypothetical protein
MKSRMRALDTKRCGDLIVIAKAAVNAASSRKSVTVTSHEKAVVLAVTDPNNSLGESSERSMPPMSLASCSPRSCYGVSQGLRVKRSGHQATTAAATCQ